MQTKKKINTDFHQIIKSFLLCKTVSRREREKLNSKNDSEEWSQSVTAKSVVLNLNSERRKFSAVWSKMDSQFMDAGTYAWIVIVIFFIIFTSVCVSLDKMVMFTKKPFFSVFYFFRFFLSFLCFFDFSSETNFILKSVFSFQLSSKSQFDHYFLVGRKIDFFS